MGAVPKPEPLGGHVGGRLLFLRKACPPLVVVLSLAGHAARAVGAPQLTGDDQHEVAESENGVRREWRTRRWALDLEQYSKELAAALASPAWQERYLALDALARAPLHATGAVSRSGAAPNGARPDGAEPGRATPDGATPDGARPDGARPDGAEPGSAKLRAVAQTGVAGGAAELVARAAALVTDEHPNVRARALAALSRNLLAGLASCNQSAPEALLATELLTELAGDPLPDTRLALAHHLGYRALAEEDGPAPAILLVLTRDSDVSVRARARRELVALGPGAEDQQAALLATLLADNTAAGRERVTRALLSMARAPRLSPDLLLRLRGLVSDSMPAGQRLSQEAQFAAVELIHLVNTERRAVHRDGEGHPVRRLAEGWLAAERAPHGALVRSLLVLGARAGGEPVARALLDMVVDLGDSEEWSAPFPDLPALAGDLARVLLVDGILEASLPQRAVALPGTARLTPAASSLLWDLAALEAHAWSPTELEPWFARSAPPLSDAEDDPWLDTRLAILNALAGPLVREDHHGSGDLLARFLDDSSEQMGEAAFQALCDAPRAEVWFAQLHAHWSARPRLLQLTMLELLPRSPAAISFRDDLLALGAEPATRTISVVELLGAFRGDAQVAAALDRWLGQSLERLEDAGTELAFRRAEGRARGALRALLAVAAGLPDGGTGKLEIVERLSTTLERTQFLLPPLPSPGSSMGGVSDGGVPQLELPKACVAGLGQLDLTTGVGLKALEELVAADEGAGLTRRVRVEVFIALANAGRLAGAGTLAADYAHCDGDLRLRILRALAHCAPRESTGGAQAPGFLTAILSDGRMPLEERAVACESLRRWTMGALEARQISQAQAEQLGLELAGHLRSSMGLDLRRVILAQLEHIIGGEQLLAAFGAHLDVSLARLAPGPRREEAELLWGDLLVAGARFDGLAGREQLCLSRPLSLAAENLAARFAGEPLAAVTFAWRAELAAAEILQERGRLGEVLAADDGLLSRLEGRLLLALGSNAMGAEPRTAFRILAAVPGALWGEGAGAWDGRRAGEIQACVTLARIHSLALAHEKLWWPEAEALALEILHAWRRGDLHRQVFDDFEGAFDPVLGVDPAGRLERIIEEARAATAGMIPPASSPPRRDG